MVPFIVLMMDRGGEIWYLSREQTPVKNRNDANEWTFLHRAAGAITEAAQAIDLALTQGTVDYQEMITFTITQQARDDT